MGVCIFVRKHIKNISDRFSCISSRNFNQNFAVFFRFVGSLCRGNYLAYHCTGTVNSRFPLCGRRTVSSYHDYSRTADNSLNEEQCHHDCSKWRCYTYLHSSTFLKAFEMRLLLFNIYPFATYMNVYHTYIEENNKDRQPIVW